MSRALALGGFAARLRLRAYVRSGPLLAWAALLAVVAVAHGVGLAVAMEAVPALEARASAAPAVALAALVLILWIEPFFPAYRTVAEPVPAYEPVGRWERALVGVLWDLLRLPLPVAVLFLVSLSLAAPTVDAAWLARAVAVAVAALLLQRSARILAERSITGRALHAVVVAASGALLLGTAAEADPRILATTAIALGVALHHAVLAGAATAAPVARTASGTRGAAGRGTQPAFTATAARLVARTRRAVIPLGVAMALKSVIVVFMGPVASRPDAVPVAAVLLLVILSPFMLFTYVLNNAFGYFPAGWETVRIHGSRAGDTLRLYGSLAAPLLALDAAVSLAGAFFLGLPLVAFVAFYAGAAAALLAIGLWSSLVDPRRIGGDELVRLRSAVSPWFSMGATLPMAAAAAGLFQAGLAGVSLAGGLVLLAAVALLARRSAERLGPRVYERLEAPS